MRSRIRVWVLALAAMAGSGVAHAAEPLRVGMVPDAGATQVSMRPRNRRASTGAAPPLEMAMVSGSRSTMAGVM